MILILNIPFGGDGDAEFNGVAYGRAENENPDQKIPNTSKRYTSTK